MKTEYTHFFPCLVFLFLATGLLSACGPGNEIKLLALDQPDVSVLPKPNAPTVTVVEFNDDRSDTSSIGQRRDKSAFLTSESPTLWISHALADCLARHGVQVSYATSFEQARKANPDYIVTGKLLRLWIKEPSATYLETNIEAQFTLANRTKHLCRETHKAQSSRSWPASSSQTENMLRDTMQDLVEPYADKFANIIWNNKK
ncbi:MAG: hypothetical protein J5803_00495 [Desulfovibrio sp.]|nr:hypothetical protein [Desulfovibrio sp.]